MSQQEVAHSWLALGCSYVEKTNLSKAEPLLIDAREAFLQLKDISQAIVAQSNLLRIYGEQNRLEDIKKIEVDLLSWEEKGHELTAYAQYCLALCLSYEQNQLSALSRLDKALEIAEAHKEITNICRALQGRANVYYRLEQFEEALQELDRLEIYLQTGDHPQLKMISLITRALITRDMGDPKQALPILEKACAATQESKDFYTYIQALFHMGMTYLKLEDKTMALIYLGQAQKLVDPKELTLLSEAIDRRLQEAHTTLLFSEDEKDESADFDLIYDQRTSHLIRQGQVCADLRNQFVLRDLLTLFMENPGRVYSKEELAKKIWQQVYDPQVHDNKIYVTIKRLRKLVEPSYDSPQYVCRTKDGYYLNQSAKVLIQ